MSDVGTVETTCDDWTDADGTGDRGVFTTVDRGFWGSGVAADCSFGGTYLFCVEQ